jgi:hypothetical protein
LAPIHTYSSMSGAAADTRSAGTQPRAPAVPLPTRVPDDAVRRDTDTAAADAMT